jgi:very-short-patch-repair endonuclease
MNLLLNRAKALRKEQTPAEQLLWKALRNRQLNGLKFYRQRVIGYYIADFYCPELKLILEADGDVHFTDEQQTHDAKRNQWFEAEGYRVLRVLNSDVVQNLEGVLQVILNLPPVLHKNLSPTLSLKGEGAEEETKNPLPLGRGQGEGVLQQD